MKSTQKIIICLFCTNVITFFLLLIVALYYDIPTKLYTRINFKNTSIAHAGNNFSRNKRDIVRREYFKIYSTKKANIVMLGDSITHQIDWNELLGRSDIVNRGIGGDTSEDIVNRLSDIYTLNPKICFVMCGLNDFFKSKTVENVFSNYTKIIEGIRNNKIIPVIQSTLYITNKHDKKSNVNSKIYKLNKLLKKYAQTNNVLFIDLNKSLSRNRALCSKYSFDGKHLLGKGYAQWKEVLVPNISSLLSDLADKPHNRPKGPPPNRLSLLTNRH
jgi:lysophospholipase L1-like esterase